ncbi:MAG TPA: bifunctional diaminohydroxyphosphoribosylaminopyrimidine deaminase/5-amino-6-(5-phosphoribosylamino)uracil reductase RibD [Arenimonas sp.]|nr:bifunctional diaminohydroxyphosphoribosylaminopyrimidine deaminase/5-amino-6-(5-phosphoribosylamino)uracil reductase RibD [Arenimonas sp.]
MEHADYMRQAMRLALQAKGRTWPNPMVGCVIVKDGNVIAEGLHRQAGEAHAELDAINNAIAPVRGATAYVNLEPCCHLDKRTPPCAQRLIAEGIKTVVIANVDPHPAVSGGGIALLREAGVEVITGVLAEPGEQLNEVFFHNQRTGRPFVHLKLASTLDGKIAMADGQSQWITGEAARQHAHQLRAEHMAIAVGAQTLRQDDPQLNVRLPGYAGPQPLRLVFSRTGDVPRTAKVFSDADSARTQLLVKPDLDAALAGLYRQGIVNLLLEGGAGLAGSFLAGGHVQRISHYLNPSYLGQGKSALDDYGLTHLSQRIRLNHVEYTALGEDLYITGRV